MLIWGTRVGPLVSLKNGIKPFGCSRNRLWQRAHRATFATKKSASLDTIHKAHKRIQRQSVMEGEQRDIVGLRKGNMYSTVWTFAGYLSLFWVTLAAIRRVGLNVTAPATSDVGLHSQMANTSIPPGDDTAEAKDSLTYRLIQPFVSRFLGHLAPPLHDVLVRSDTVDDLLYQLHDFFVAPHRRQLQLECLHQLTTRRQLCSLLLERVRNMEPVRHPMLAAANVRRTGDNPSEMLSVLDRLFCGNGSFTEVPEGVRSLLCSGFWPVLRLLVTPGNLTWQDLYTAAGYTGFDSTSAQLPYTDIPQRTPTLLYVVMDLVSACPPSEREVPLGFLNALVNTNQEFWDQPFKREEYRAHLLRLLLENRENALKVFDAEANRPALQQLSTMEEEQIKCTPNNAAVSESPEKTQGVLEFLYAHLSSGTPTVSTTPLSASPAETRNIVYLALLNINTAVRERCREEGSRVPLLKLPPSGPGRRSSPVLQHALRYTHYWNTFLLGAMTAAGTTLLCVPRTTAPIPLLCYWIQVGLASLGLEIVYTFEEKCLSRINYTYSWIAELLTAAFIPVNALACSVASSRFLLSFIPFAYYRSGVDSLTDAFREL